MTANNNQSHHCNHSIFASWNDKSHAVCRKFTFHKWCFVKYRNDFGFASSFVCLCVCKCLVKCNFHTSNLTLSVSFILNTCTLFFCGIRFAPYRYTTTFSLVIIRAPPSFHFTSFARCYVYRLTHTINAHTPNGIERVTYTHTQTSGVLSNSLTVYKRKRFNKKEICIFH